MIQILEIVAYSHDGRARTIRLAPGKVNIISGDSRTGKSATLEVINYCFGSKELYVPEGKIRRNVSWFGLLLSTPQGGVFIARKVPTGEGKSSDAVYYETGNVIAAPSFAQLKQITNRDGLRLLLSSWVGITDYLHTPPAHQSRDPLIATIRHALGLCLQTQDEIARKFQLLHNTSDRDVAQALKDTLPYFLGAVTDDYISKQQNLKRIRLLISGIERQLSEAAAIRGEGLSRADTLLTEAKSVGLTDIPDNAEWDEKISVLKSIQSTPMKSSPPEGVDLVEFRRLTTLRNDLLRQQSALQDSLQRARTFESASRSFTAEVKEHSARLQAVSIFEGKGEHDACPLCSQNLPDAIKIPTIGELKSAQDQINARGGAASTVTPGLDFAMQEVEDKLNEIRDSLLSNRERLTALKRSSDRAQLASDMDGRRALTIGRISLYVENIPDVPDLSIKQRELDALRAQEKSLYDEISTESIQQRLDSCLSHVNNFLSRYAKQIELEFSDSPLRLDVRSLTIVADTPERPVPMSGIGSGENHVGYHIAAHLALHAWFAMRQRPVPAFIFFDQPSQAHFSPDAPINNRDPALIDADRRAVKKLYQLMFDAVDEAKGGFQVIITDHPDFKDDPRFQSALRETWRNGLKLIPEDWPKG